MRRGIKVTDYIEVRIGQLKEELAKPNSEHDKNWYNRLIQELDWARQMQTSPDKNCYMETK
jgi:primosomal protein N''